MLNSYFTGILSSSSLLILSFESRLGNRNHIPFSEKNVVLLLLGLSTSVNEMIVKNLERKRKTTIHNSMNNSIK